METLEIRTEGRDQFIDITNKVEAAVARLGLQEGAVIVYVPHTTAGILINEHADPTVAHDIQADLDRLIPWDQPYYRHREGNSPSHARASLVGSSEMILVESGKLQLGTWQGIFFCEFDGPRNRRVFVKALTA
jgi:secondary thiamine-phosphate synthase enzyme